jgi:D-alanyl-D-alanine carboxypeptidase/D-alanyl-D-alanine-endopeptidase (penicillin-binding protein 4)
MRRARTSWLPLALAVAVAWVTPRHASAQDAAPAAAAPSSAARPDGQRVRAAVARLGRAARERGGRVSIAVVDLATGASLAAQDASRPLNPASNMKLITAWAALHALGASHRFETTLRGRITGARLEALHLVGGGDPSLEPRHLAEMARELERRGVREVGRIVVDQSRFDAEHAPPGFDAQPHEWAPFRAPVAAASVAGNTVELVVHPAKPGELARLEAVPASHVQLGGEVRTAPSGSKRPPKLALAPAGRRLGAIFSGTVAAGDKPVRFVRRVADPSLLAGHALGDACAAAGIAVVGEVALGPVDPGAPLLFETRSEPLARLLAAVGKDSNNFYAEMIFKALGAGDGAQPATFARAAERIRALLAQHGVETSGLEVRNGSGLYDGGRVSAATLVSLLAAAWRDPKIGPDFVAQLAVGGVDGSLAGRFRASSGARVVRAKTGTLAGAVALSGYVLAPDGAPPVAFALLANTPRGRAAALRAALDALADAIARELHGH